ncbi:MAG: hypothetical protein ABFD07_04090 [Methanobacterium sp.]
MIHWPCRIRWTTIRITIRTPALLCIQIQVAFVNPIYTTYRPLGIPGGIKKYINKPVPATTKSRVVRIRSIK